MKASPLLVSWHNDHAPIYSAHFEPHGKGRLATSGGDNNVRLWRIEGNGDERKALYLTTLIKHTQAVNVVRFAPKGEMLATAGDDGNTLLWVPAETPAQQAFGEDGLEDQETWRVKHMCRSFGSEIYDLAWSPDGVFFITGSMDNIARIYNAQTGQMVRQIAEHNHYVQGVAWDPLNEFVATQSSDRSVHIYTLKTKDGQFTLHQHNKLAKMDLPSRRVSRSSPAPPEFPPRVHALVDGALAPPSPASIPSTPLPMNPPPMSHSRRSSFGSPSHRRSASPAPSIPLPAVRPMETCPSPYGGLGVKNAHLYANETHTSFFRRLTFSPEGSLLFTPAGQYKTAQLSVDGSKSMDETINTVYLYTRAGFNKPPIAHLPGHKKASIAVKCSPVFYTHRVGVKPTVQITMDSSAEDAIPQLPDPMVSTSAPSAPAAMDPPLTATTMPAPRDIARPTSSPRDPEMPAGPAPALALPYRIVYAVATQDSIIVYDTQQQTPLCVVSNLHYATFTDLTWSPDGLTLIMSSSDGFCSTIAFGPTELGHVYTGSVPTMSHPHQHVASLSFSAAPSAQSSPLPTPTGVSASSLAKLAAIATSPPGPPLSSSAAPSYAYSPARSNSVSSIATQASLAPTTATSVTNAPTPTLGQVPSVGAVGCSLTALPAVTPPLTPGSGAGAGGVGLARTASAGASWGTAGVTLGAMKRDRELGGASESELDESGSAAKRRRRRRVAPVLVQERGSSTGGASVDSEGKATAGGKEDAVAGVEAKSSNRD